MGSPKSEPDRYPDEAQVRVTIPKPFAVGEYAGHIAGDPGPAQRYSHTVDDKMSALTGEPVGSVGFSNGFYMLQIGKALVEKDPTFANPDRKHDLLKAIDEIHICDHCVTVTLTEQEMAEASMRVTHEKDLPRA
jgi:hypothetical protein